MLLLLPAVAAFQPAPLRMLPRAARSGFLPVGKAGTDGQPADDVKITIRKPEARTAAPESVFVAQFAHVKPSVATFLKFWLMGGSADGWAGTGELEAQHSPSGTKASILVDVEQATVTLVSPSAASADGCPPLNQYAIALLDELESLAKTEEAAAADRLCYPPEAVDAVRMAAWAACAPRDYGGGGAAGGEQGGGSETEFDKFLREQGLG